MCTLRLRPPGVVPPVCHHLCRALNRAASAPARACGTSTSRLTRVPSLLFQRDLADSTQRMFSAPTAAVHTTPEEMGPRPVLSYEEEELLDCETPLAAYWLKEEHHVRASDDCKRWGGRCRRLPPDLRRPDLCWLCTHRPVRVCAAAAGVRAAPGRAAVVLPPQRQRALPNARRAPAAGDSPPRRGGRRRAAAGPIPPAV